VVYGEDVESKVTPLLLLGKLENIFVDDCALFVDFAERGLCNRRMITRAFGLSGLTDVGEADDTRPLI
jgi:hypothetical protein